MAELTSMANIGPEMARKLRAVGIGSAEDLIEAGSRQAFFQLKTLYPKVCLVHLYALEGAIQNVEFNTLPEGRKRELRAFSDLLKGKTRRPECDAAGEMPLGDTLTLAERSDLEAVLGLIEARITWMDRKGIRQWNVTGYRDAYPRAYYERQIEQGRLYVLRRAPGGPAAGAAVLLDEDGRWADCPADDAWYLHNFVADVRARGAGGVLLRLAETMAGARGKRRIRLDCAADNAALNAYYERRGYHLRGRCADGPYVGNRREKTLDRNIKGEHP